jgi:hypothetical protein
MFKCKHVVLLFAVKILMGSKRFIDLEDKPIVSGIFPPRMSEDYLDFLSKPDWSSYFSMLRSSNFGS